MENSKQKLVDIGDLDVKKILRALIDVKKQNAQLFDAIKRLDKKDKYFDDNVKSLFHIAGNIRIASERELSQLQHFMANIEDNRIDEKFLDKIANVNRPNSESIKYGQAFISLRKSFLDRAVKRASEKTKDNKPSE